VIVDHRPVIHLVDVIAGENDHVVGAAVLDEAQVLVDGVGGAGVPVLAFARLVGLEQAHAAAAAIQIPRLADADMVVQAVGRYCVNTPTV
jgi:hypothetical protein